MIINSQNPNICSGLLIWLQICFLREGTDTSCDAQYISESQIQRFLGYILYPQILKIIIKKDYFDLDFFLT